MGKLCLSVEIVGSFRHGSWSRGECPKQNRRRVSLCGNTVWRAGFAFYFLVFAWATDLSTDLECQLSISCKCYEAAYEILLFSNLKNQNPEQRIQVLKRMGNIRNEIGVFYMNQAAAVQTERVGKYSSFYFLLWSCSLRVCEILGISEKTFK